MFPIEVKGLTRDFDGLRAVENLSFSVSKGEMFCIVGPDGAGKTTLIRMLCGIVRPTSGTARILGFDLLREGEKIKPHLGYLSQRFSLYGDLTIDENIEFFAEVHTVGDYKKRREELLDFTRLKPFRKRLAENLSGGMKQKLALACTLIHTPEVLILDEPTTGVDPVSRRDFWKILFRLIQSGITILLTTPYLDEAERGSRVALIHAGRFLVADTPGRVKSLMRGDIIELVPRDRRQAISFLKRRSEIKEVQAFGDRLHLVLADADSVFPSLLTLLEEKEITVHHWRKVQPSLENVFISLTREAAKESKGPDISPEGGR